MGKTAHGFHLIERIFHRRISEVVEQLHAVDPQHGSQRIRRPAVISFGIVSGQFPFDLLLRKELFRP